ncbi:hypothetical protein D3C71_1523050 [compost metagenome]
MHAPDRPLAERQRAVEPRHRQPVRNVLLRFLRGERIEMKTGDHSLRQLLHRRARHHRAQLGLADEDDLQQLALAGFQIGQQTQLLQHVSRQVLRLVDDEHVVAAAGVRRQQRGIERVNAVFDRLHPWHSGRMGHSKLVAD